VGVLALLPGGEAKYALYNTHTSSIDKENTEGGLANTGGVHLVDVSALLPGGEVSDLRCSMPYAILQ